MNVLKQTSAMQDRSFSAWLYVAVGGLMDILWATGLKYSQGFRLFWPSLFVLCCIGISYTLYIKAMMRLPAGTAYTVFTGIGAAGTAAAGMLLLDEPAGFWRIFFILLLLGGMIGLKLTAGDEGEAQEHCEEIVAAHRGGGPDSVLKGGEVLNTPAASSSDRNRGGMQ
ncbi:DMT family transporter [Paenibacillus borealis]|uniref:DMT family transporter n=1 Tax=Paenibacillus borealis TaxID=160799 RepID=UPI000A9523C8|nr:multidrug efflux SMR transporter [Paenibacillus borealis]